MVNSNDNENESSNHVEFILNLKPLQGSTKYNEVYAAIKLHFRLSKTYPESSPSIQLEDGCGMLPCNRINLQCLDKEIC